MVGGRSLNWFEAAYWAWGRFEREWAYQRVAGGSALPPLHDPVLERRLPLRHCSTDYDDLKILEVKKKRSRLRSVKEGLV